MKIGYLHCFSGISGDMFLGALADAGVSPELLSNTARSLGLGAELQMQRVDRSGISAIHFRVIDGDSKMPVEDLGTAAGSAHTHSHGMSHTHSHAHSNGHADSRSHTHSEVQPDSGAENARAQHLHSRSLPAIRRLIEEAELPRAVKETSIRAFELLAAAEAKVHNIAVDQVHFHEVGAVDAIVDIVCGCAGALALGIDRWISSPLNVGSGMVRCAHGNFPVPAPAALDLLAGAPIYSEGPEGERVTPTGAALLRALGCSFGSLPAISVSASGYGAGSRNPAGSPNVLRLVIGDAVAGDSVPGDHAVVLRGSGELPGQHGEAIAVLECAIDDSTPQVLAYCMEKALLEGACDVMATPVLMKKNRMGTLLTVLCRPDEVARFREMLFRETSTIGIRTRIERRHALAREFVKVMTEWGEVSLKVARWGNTVANFTPEYEDCRRLAEAHGIPLKLVQQAASAKYLEMESLAASHAEIPAAL